MTFTKPRGRQWLILRLMLLGGLVGRRFISVFGQTTEKIQSASSSSSSSSEETALLDTDEESILLLNNEVSETTHHTDHHHRSLQGVNGNQLKQKFQVAKAKMIQKLQNDYGAELFEATFMTSSWKGGTERVTQGRRFFLSPSVPKDRIATNENEGPSWDRLVRRMAVKILQSQLQNDKEKMIPFIWATGGHSAAAGHGNFYNESYTFTMEKNSKGVFEAVGLDLVGRNYAMGGTTSGRELASCVNAIYGQDMDVLSWDFGMTDGRNAMNMEHYIYRSQTSPSRPAFFGFGIKFGRENVLKRFEDMGLTTLYELDTVYRDILAEMPKCDEMSPSDIEAMPPMVRECRCTKSEDNGGQTICSEEKWSDYGNSTCQNRKFRTSWHPGWKWHGLVGNLMALSLMEVLGDAVNLIVNQGSDPEALLKELQKQQNDEFKLFTEGPLPENAPEVFSKTDIDMQAVFKGPNYCHTARLPAETRHLGILTESEEKGFYDYFKGQPFRDAKPINGVTPLVYDPSERQACAPHVGMDYKDWFHYHGDWSTLTVPNALEKQVYGPTTTSQQTTPAIKGYVLLCFVACPFNKCPKDSINDDALTSDRADIRVNNNLVTELMPFGIDCVFLKGEQGYVWKPDSNGQFEVSAKIKEAGSTMRVSAVILY